MIDSWIRMYEARSVEYIRIYESIVFLFFPRLKIHKIGPRVSRFNIEECNLFVSINIRYAILC